MRNSKQLSIIIVNYNSFLFLSRCLASIRKYFDSLDYEIILVDNNSTEGDIHDVVDEYKNVNLILNQQNVGFAKANNQALEYVSSEYTLLLNNDTEFIDKSIQDLFNYVKTLDGDFLIGCQLLNKDGSKQESVVEFPSLWNTFTESFFLYKLFPKTKLLNKYYQNFHEYDIPIEVDVIKGAFMFGKTQTFKELNGFDESFFFYSEETDLCYRVKNNMNGKIIFYPAMRVYHFGGTKDNEYNWFKIKNLSIGKIQYYQKHFKSIRLILILAIHYSGIFIRVLYNFILGIIILNKTKFRKSYYFLKSLFVYPINKFK